MRVIVPYATLYPETRESVLAHDPAAEFIHMSYPSAYHDLLEATWAAGEAFTIVEQDIVPWPGALLLLERCKELWCGFAYRISHGYVAALGCTRFSAELLRDHPSAVLAIDQLPYDGTPRRQWQRLDTRLKQSLEDREKVTMHVHWPAVGHLNPAQNGPLP